MADVPGRHARPDPQDDEVSTTDAWTRLTDDADAPTVDLNRPLPLLLHPAAGPVPIVRPRRAPLHRRIRRAFARLLRSLR